MDIVIHKLELRSALSPDEKAALRAAFATVRNYQIGEDLLREGDTPPFVGALLSGFLCRYKPLPDGQRQIVAFPVPGDIFDLHSFTVDTMDHSVGALANCVAATATHAAIEDLAISYPRLGMLLWRDAVVEGSIFREWIVNCGRRSAYARISHLLCEHYLRMQEVGLVTGSSCDMPLTQNVIADATGLSVVHVNRILQQLRAEGLIVLKSGRLTVLNWAELVAAAGFDPTYLHLDEHLRVRRGFAFAEPGGWSSRRASNDKTGGAAG